MSSSTPRFLVYGHQGWIGQQVTKLLKPYKEGEFLALGKARIDDYEGVLRDIIQSKPTHIISLTGRTHGTINGKEITTIDYLEQPGKLVENIRDNLYGPWNLAKICDDLNLHLTYLGTGCIFEYDAQHPYGDEKTGFKPQSAPNFFGSSYSIVKGFTDQMMKQYPRVLNIRIRMPITDDVSPRNFITKIVNYQKICSVPNSMTVLPELLPIMIDMAKQGKTGTVNLVNPGLITHNEILQMYKDIVDPTFTWQNFTLEEQAKILASGRSNNCLDTSDLQKEYPKVMSIHDSVRQTLHRMKAKMQKS